MQWGNGAHDRSCFISQRKTSKRGNGDGGDRSIAIAMAIGKEDWGNGNCNGTGAMGQLQQQLQWQWGVGGDVYVLFRGSMSCIVVDENVQNVWTAILREVVPVNKTCMIWSVFGNGPNEIYSGH
jgi:hypothetical protein